MKFTAPTIQSDRYWIVARIDHIALHLRQTVQPVNPGTEKQKYIFGSFFWENSGRSEKGRIDSTKKGKQESGGLRRQRRRAREDSVTRRLHYTQRGGRGCLSWSLHTNTADNPINLCTQGSAKYRILTSSREASSCRVVPILVPTKTHTRTRSSLIYSLNALHRCR